MEFVDPKFLDHFMHPRNTGTIEDPDGTGMSGDPDCGDWLIVTLRVASGVIEDIRFQCRGCSSAIATSSAMTELVKGLTIADALRVTGEDIEREVGGLTEAKRHCSLLGETALKNAIADLSAG